MSSTAVFLIAFAFVFGGALMGVGLRKALPEQHLADDTKDVVRLGTGLIGTIAALVLGLLIASANGSFQTQSGQVQRMTADVILLDTLLAQYGPEAQTARELLRSAVGLVVERIWRENSSAAAAQAPFHATDVGEEAFGSDAFTVASASREFDTDPLSGYSDLLALDDFCKLRLVFTPQCGRGRCLVHLCTVGVRRNLSNY